MKVVCRPRRFVRVDGVLRGPGEVFECQEESAVHLIRAELVMPAPEAFSDSGTNSKKAVTDEEASAEPDKIRQTVSKVEPDKEKEATKEVVRPTRRRLRLSS